jgi:hypothetical protein
MDSFFHCPIVKLLLHAIVNISLYSARVKSKKYNNMRFLRTFKKVHKIKSEMLTFKVCLAFKVNFLKIIKFNNFDDF